MLANARRLPGKFRPLPAFAELQWQRREADQWPSPKSRQGRGEQGSAGKQMWIARQIIRTVDARTGHFRGLAIRKDSQERDATQAPCEFRDQPLALDRARRVGCEPLIAAEVGEAELLAKPLP